MSDESWNMNQKSQPHAIQVLHNGINMSEQTKGSRENQSIQGKIIRSPASFSLVTPFLTCVVFSLLIKKLLDVKVL